MRTIRLMLSLTVTVATATGAAAQQRSPGTTVTGVVVDVTGAVAIHYHMTDTRPIIYFPHDWGTGPADKLATGFNAAVDQLATPRSAASKR